MELRFVEGNFEHGKFKLQYRHEWDGTEAPTSWEDVPCVKENGPWVCNKCGSTWDCWEYCAKCGAGRT